MEARRSTVINTGSGLLDCEAESLDNPVSQAKIRCIRYSCGMAGIRGRSGPPGNQNAFRHGLAGVAQRRADGVLSPQEQSIREEILSGLLADKGGAAQISTAIRVLAEIIASDVSLLVTFNTAIDGVLKNNAKARANPKALAQLDGYKRPLVSSLSGNLQRFGMERVARIESLQEIIADMTESTDTNERTSAACPSPSLSERSDAP